MAVSLLVLEMGDWNCLSWLLLEFFWNLVLFFFFILIGINIKRCWFSLNVLLLGSFVIFVFVVELLSPVLHVLWDEAFVFVINSIEFTLKLGHLVEMDIMSVGLGC